MNKIKNHLWYLSEQLIALSFFDDEISIDTKQKMMEALEKSAEPEPPKKINVDINAELNANIEDFVTIKTKTFFEINDLPSSFLEKSVEDWAEDEAFLASQKMIRHQKVVNDIAERGVKLIEDNKLITRNEQQKQYLLQVVSEYRKKMKDKKKSTLISLAKIEKLVSEFRQFFTMRYN